MHRDLARYIVLLAAVRVLCIAATPAPHPWRTSEINNYSRHSFPAGAVPERAIRDVTSRHPSRPRPGGPVPPATLRQAAPETRNVLERHLRAPVDSSPNIRFAARLEQ